MILLAKYTGPYPEVTVPGFVGKVTLRDKPVKIRVPDGMPLGGCWDIIEGAKEYKAAIEAREADLKAKHDAKAKRAADQAAKIAKAQPDITDTYLANGEKDFTKAKPASKTVGGAK